MLTSAGTITVAYEIADNIIIKAKLHDVRLVANHNRSAVTVIQFYVSYTVFNEIVIASVSFLRSQGMLFQASDEIYGPGGEKLSDEEVLAWAEEKGYVRVKHIVYYFYDDTGLPLDETGKEALRARAAAVSEELRALAESDPGAVEERFDELMYAETGDPGLAGYPDGYTFTRETSM